MYFIMNAKQRKSVKCYFLKKVLDYSSRIYACSEGGEFRVLHSNVNWMLHSIILIDVLLVGILKNKNLLLHGSAVRIRTI